MKTATESHISNIKGLILNGNIQVAIVEAYQFAEQKKYSGICDELVLLSSRYQSLKDDESKGVIQRELYNTEHNRIASSLLDILNKTEELVSKKAEIKSKIPSREYGIVSIILIVLILFLILWIKMPLKQGTKPYENFRPQINDSSLVIIDAENTHSTSEGQSNSSSTVSSQKETKDAKTKAIFNTPLEKELIKLIYHSTSFAFRDTIETTPKVKIQELKSALIDNYQLKRRTLELEEFKNILPNISAIYFSLKLNYSEVEDESQKLENLNPNDFDIVTLHPKIIVELISENGDQIIQIITNGEFAKIYRDIASVNEVGTWKILEMHRHTFYQKIYANLEYSVRKKINRISPIDENMVEDKAETILAPSIQKPQIEKIEGEPILLFGFYGLFIIPSGFSPNGDGVNDYFKLTYNVLGTEPSDFNFTIFDTRGRIIFTSSELNFIWDGKYNGRYLPGGVYMFILELETDRGSVTKIGPITLIR